jgi:hypothetical protein
MLHVLYIYKEPSIIFGTDTAVWSKCNFGPTGHHTRCSPLPRSYTVPSASAIFKCILEVVFCEDVQHSLRFCLDHLNCQNDGLSVLSSIGEKRKVGWVGDEGHVVFGLKRPGEKESMGR